MTSQPSAAGSQRRPESLPGPWWHVASARKLPGLNVVTKAGARAGILLLSLLLGCGGGGGGGTVQPIPPPLITSFTAAKSPITQGTSTTLLALFTGGTGTINAGVGLVSSGVAVSTGTLTSSTTFTLTVTNSAGTAVATTTTVVVNGLPGTLGITLTGLPQDLNGLVKVFGPVGYVHSTVASETLTGLVAGTYALVPSGLWSGAGQTGEAYLASGAQSLVVAAGGTTSATITYAATPSLTFQLADPSSPTGTLALNVNFIPAGAFLMGAQPGEQDSADVEFPQHPVTLSRGFYVADDLTTQAQWKALMGTNPAWFSLGSGGAATDDFTRPVEFVSWNDLNAASTGFLTKLNAATAATRPAGLAFRLPTEAEWEYACRAGTTTRFFWGDDPTYTTLNQYAWWSGDSGATTHPVGSLGAGSANPFGLFDMTGNVWEWCGDWYGPYTTATATDPTGPATGSYHVVRGGSWFHGDTFCRSANRSYSGPDDRFSSIGFRVVLAQTGP
jgi:formylglycine-generating enzyme required for sulfatase activity